MQMITNNKLAPAVMLMDAVKAMPSNMLLNTLYTALADKKDLSAEHLEQISNMLGRIAWDRARN